MIILPTWVLILGTCMVFLLGIVLGLILGGTYLSIKFRKLLNDSEYEAFESLWFKASKFKNIRQAKEES